MAGRRKAPMQFVPLEYCRSLRKVSKAHLADLVWDLAGRLAERGADELESVFAVITAHSDRVSFDRGDTSIGAHYDRERRQTDKAERRMIGPEL